MSIKKQVFKNKPIVKVTFEIDKEVAKNAISIHLLSEHNDWQEIEFKKFKNGKFKVSENISIKKHQHFQFIYKVISSIGVESTLLPEGLQHYVDNDMNDGGKNAVLIIAE